MKKLILLDTHAILHRAYHALPDFVSTKGEPTGALYGLVLMIFKIIKDLSPDYIVACYDLEKPTHRHIVFKEYKANRQKTKEDLISQIKKSKELLSAFGIPVYEKAGFEADDLLGTIAKQVSGEKDIKTIITSGDMDTLQLVKGEKVVVYTLRKGIKDTILYTEKDVKERYGFGPESIADYKGLRGDPSDNIPGIAGIGEKTATTVISNIGSIEKLYETKEEKLKEIGLTDRMIKLIQGGQEDALFSKTLAQIHTDAPIKFSLPKDKFGENVDSEKIITLLNQLEFRSLIEQVKNIFSIESEDKEEENVSLEDEKITSLALWTLDSGHVNPDIDDILKFTRQSTFKKAKEYIFEDLKKTGQDKVFNKIELPLMSVIEKMEKRGVKIDTKYLEKLSKEYHRELEKLQSQIRQMVGEEFNINSPKQLSEILFDKMRIPVSGLKKTAGGARSTRESELEKIKDKHPVIENVLLYRELQKLLTTYIDSIPKQVDKKDKRLHADFVQSGTATGRMSSRNPNLQNIPIKSYLGQRVRNAFVAEKGLTLASFDYSQIELRIAAFLSKDPKMIEIFSKKGDIHQAVASEVFDVSPEKVDSEMRRRAKIISFGMIYGMGINALQKQLGTSRKEAGDFHDKYFERFGGLTEYMEETKGFVRKNGYTETFFGRRRYLPDIKSRIPYLRATAERMAINTPIQGTQADIIKIAMINVDRMIEEKYKGKIFLLLQIHDELVYEVDDDVLEEAMTKIKSLMEESIFEGDKPNIPFSVDMSFGQNWGEMKKK
jgi:DNA polymerase-1